MEALRERDALRVYPRTYGGTVELGYTSVADAGLSPHIRGNADVTVELGQRLGSIPAHTGERRRYRGARAAFGVYPRTYGGTDIAVQQGSNEWGLSPHIRGNERSNAHRERLPRSIPAHTGERQKYPREGLSCKVYPRTYGGTIMNQTGSTNMRGLSPHIRGNG